MPRILSTGLCVPPYRFSQEEISGFIKELFKDSFKDIDRLIKVFSNGDIQRRYFSVPVEWFKKPRPFSEKNQKYIDCAIEYSQKAITNCLTNNIFLKTPFQYDDIDALFFVSTTGLSTPSIDARLMNQLPFSSHLKRIPIWGLGCAGGAAGLARAYDYCQAYPEAKVLVCAAELCSLTFQEHDQSKSNLIGTSLFADGVACALIVGDRVPTKQSKLTFIPNIIETQSTLLENAEDIMGWQVEDDGLHVIFSRDIPTVVQTWVKKNIEQFLLEHNLYMEEIDYFIAHPGGKKVIEAYKNALNIIEDKLEPSRFILKNYGNMSSVTVLFVLDFVMKMSGKLKNNKGLITALGPGFSSELLLVNWEEG